MVVSADCYDVQGNMGTASVKLKIDKTAPTAVLTPSGTAGANGWFTSDVTVKTTGTDDISGPVVCSPDQTLTSETAGTAVNGSCTNQAGLSTDASPISVKIDKTAPAATLTPSGTAGANGWFTSDVTVKTTGTDDISGPVSCSPDQTLTSETAGTAVNGSCTNQAGLSTDASPISVKIDKTAPAATLTPSGTAGANGWFTSDVTVKTSGTDDISGPVVCSPDQTLTSETAGTAVDGSCTNQAGLSTDASPISVKIDKTAPAATLTPSGTAGANGWFTSDVTVKTTGTDDISGPVVCSPDQTLTSETAGTAVNGSCTIRPV